MGNKEGEALGVSQGELPGHGSQRGLGHSPTESPVQETSFGAGRPRWPDFVEPRTREESCFILL